MNNFPHLKTSEEAIYLFKCIIPTNLIATKQSTACRKQGQIGFSLSTTCSLHVLLSWNTVQLQYMVLQEKKIIYWKVIISVIVTKKKLTWTCLILKGYWDKAVSISRPQPIRFLNGGLVEERSLQKKDGYMKQITHSCFGCCCPHKEMWR